MQGSVATLSDKLAALHGVRMCVHVRTCVCAGSCARHDGASHQSQWMRQAHPAAAAATAAAEPWQQVGSAIKEYLMSKMQRGVVRGEYV